MSTGLKTFIIILIIIVFGAIGYLLFTSDGSSLISGSTSTSPLQTSTGAPVSGLASTGDDIDADQIGQEFLTQLLNIRSIKLRDDVFSRPAFVSLIDFTIELIQQGNEGRDNPFAPFGFDSAQQEIIDPLTGLPIEDQNASNQASVIGAPVVGSGSVTPIIPSSFNSNTTTNSNLSSGGIFIPPPSLPGS